MKNLTQCVAEGVKLANGKRLSYNEAKKIAIRVLKHDGEHNPHKNLYIFLADAIQDEISNNQKGV